MSDEVKARKVRVDQLVLARDLSPDYRRLLTGLSYRKSSFSEVPEPQLLDYIVAHPPIGRMEGKEFHVFCNVRTLAIKPFLPGDRRIRVIEEKKGDRSCIESESAYRELLNLVVSEMKSTEYVRAVAGLGDLIKNNGGSKQSVFSSKQALASFVGLRRQALSEVPKKASDAQMISQAGDSNE